MNPVDHAMPPRPRLQQRPFRDIFDTVIWIGLMFTLVNFATARYVVEGISMEPNFHTGEYVLVSRVSYLFSGPQRGDIVVFHYPNNPSQDYIKRVIGLPGDVVELRAQRVYVNDAAQDDSYINEPCSSGACRDAQWVVGEGQVFVMGDNRNHSSDSRSFGPVDMQFVVGEALLRYLPLQQFGSVEAVKYPK